ncbi:unnamed protein product [Timema podura]|uniref:PH domain-containing protein n=1 Tax=Timema podura TaxID=61482 RepID=A0ABN7NFZ8_TIMPD|nr:unnamed protein product [Timema podura]
MRYQGPVKLRARSNSAESWAAAMGSRGLQASRNTLEWPPQRALQGAEESQRHKAVRQDSYLAAVRTPVTSERLGRLLKRQTALPMETPEEMEEPPPPKPTPAVRPNQLTIPHPIRPASPLMPLPAAAVVSQERISGLSSAFFKTARLIQANNDILIRELAINRKTVFSSFLNLHQWSLAHYKVSRLFKTGLLTRGVAKVKILVPSETSNVDDMTPVVVRREKNSSNLAEEERLVRRVSYLKATWGDRMHVDSDFDASDTEASYVQHQTGKKKWRPPPFLEDIEKLRQLFEESPSPLPFRRRRWQPLLGFFFVINQEQSNTAPQAVLGATLRLDINKENLQLVKEGWLHCKITIIDGKRAGDRSWKQVWAVLRGPVLYLFKDRRDLQQINLCRNRGLNPRLSAQKSDSLPLDHQRRDIIEARESRAIRPYSNPVSIRTKDSRTDTIA